MSSDSNTENKPLNEEVNNSVSDCETEETQGISDSELDIQQFQHVTNTSAEIAKQLLERSAGRLEEAINLYFREYQSDSKINYSDSDSDISPPIAPVRQTLIEHDDVYGFERFYGGYHSNRQSWEQRFMPPLEIIYVGSMSEARENASRKNKWLLINILNSYEMISEKQNSDIWSKEEAKSIISNNFVFWQVYHHTNDAKRYQQFYSVKQYPYVAILDPRTGQNLIVLEGVNTCEEMCESLNKFMIENKSPNDDSLTKGFVREPCENQFNGADENMAIGQEKEIDGDQTSNIYECSGNMSNESKIVKSEENVNWEEYLGTESSNMSKILIRYPSGKRSQIFLPRDSKLNALLLNMSALGYSKQEYDLITSFPQTNLYELPGDKLLHEAGLFPTETVIVQRKY